MLNENRFLDIFRGHNIRPMTQDYPMMRNFSRINKSTSCLTSNFQKISICFLKDFGPQCITGKIYSCDLFRIIVVCMFIYIHMWCTCILTTVNTTQRKTKNDVIGLAMTTKVTRNTTAIASRIFLKSSSAMT